MSSEERIDSFWIINWQGQMNVYMVPLLTLYPLAMDKEWFTFFIASSSQKI